MDEKKGQKRKNKIEEQLSQIRQKGAALETAIQNKKEMEQKERERKFATPSNSDEAEMQLPPLEEQLGMSMSQAEIIERGTLLQKTRLYYTLLDYEGYFGNPYTSTSLNEVWKSLQASISTEQNKETIIQCVNEYNGLQEYGEQMRYYFKRFQTSFSILARLLNLWDSYEREAQKLTATFKRWKGKDPEGAEWFVNNILICSGDGEQWEGACLRFDWESEAFSVDVELKEKRYPDAPEEEGLLSKIQKEAASTAETLSDFKAYAVVAEEFIQKGTLHYMPISIQMCLENAEEERYTRYIVKNLSFFRSEINYRRSKGETITPEEERRAVIPDYYEVEPTPSIQDDCIEALSSYWYSKERLD